jgi:hypothetical protein
LQVNLTCKVNAVEDRLEKTVIGALDKLANRLDQLSDLVDFFGSAKDALVDRENVMPNTIDTPIKSTQNDIGAVGNALDAGMNVPGVAVGGPP